MDMRPQIISTHPNVVTVYQCIPNHIEEYPKFQIPRPNVNWDHKFIIISLGFSIEYLEKMIMMMSFLISWPFRFLWIWILCRFKYINYLDMLHKSRKSCAMMIMNSILRQRLTLNTIYTVQKQLVTMNHDQKVNSDLSWTSFEYFRAPRRFYRSSRQVFDANVLTFCFWILNIFRIETHF